MKRKQQQVALLAVLLVVVFGYVLFWRSETNFSRKDWAGTEEVYEVPVSEDHPFWNDLNIKLAREYQIDLSKTLWSSNR